MLLARTPVGLAIAPASTRAGKVSALSPRGALGTMKATGETQYGSIQFLETFLHSFCQVIQLVEKHIHKENCQVANAI